MRWITFLILLFFMTALQKSSLGAIPWHNGGASGYWPSIEYLPLLAVFYALYAAEPAAPLAALLCGLACDFSNEEYIGTTLIPLALVGWLIVRVRLSIFREHFMSQLIMTLLSIVAFAVASALFRKLIGAKLEGGSVWTHLGSLSGNAVYTAILAPFLFYILFRFHHLLGFTPHGARTRGHG